MNCTGAGEQTGRLDCIYAVERGAEQARSLCPEQTTSTASGGIASSIPWLDGTLRPAVIAVDDDGKSFAKLKIQSAR